jgi:hypothetical protein
MGGACIAKDAGHMPKSAQVMANLSTVLMPPFNGLNRHSKLFDDSTDFLICFFSEIPLIAGIFFRKFYTLLC